MDRYEKLSIALDVIRKHVQEQGHQFKLVTVLRTSGIWPAEDIATLLQRYGLIKRRSTSIASPGSWTVDMHTPLEVAISYYHLHKEPDPHIRRAIMENYSSLLQLKPTKGND